MSQNDYNNEELKKKLEAQIDLKKLREDIEEVKKAVPRPIITDQAIAPYPHLSVDIDGGIKLSKGDPIYIELEEVLMGVKALLDNMQNMDQRLKRLEEKINGYSF